MNIPARYCTGYLGDIGVPRDPAPMDFQRLVRGYLDGRWFTFRCAPQSSADWTHRDRARPATLQTWRFRRHSRSGAAQPVYGDHRRARRRSATIAPRRWLRLGLSRRRPREVDHRRMRQSRGLPMIEQRLRAARRHAPPLPFMLQLASDGSGCVHRPCRPASVLLPGNAELMYQHFTSEATCMLILLRSGASFGLDHP